MGRLPNWQSRLGVGTTGGGLNMMPQQTDAGHMGGNPNLAMMIRALMQKGI